MTESGDGDLPLRVSTLELFFDLVFVFAITQLTGILANHVSVAAGVRVLLIFGVLWWMYGGYVWLANARTPSRTPERLLLLVGMAGFLIMALAIPDAFGRDGVAVGVGYLIVVVVHGWLYLRVNRNIARITAVNLAAALLVIAAGVVKGDAVPAERVRDGQPHDEEAGHPDEHEQPLRGPGRGSRVGQPDVSAVHPPQHPEDEQHPDSGGQAHVVREDPGQLGDGEDEDQVEEQLEGADPQRKIPSLVRQCHSRAAMSRRYQPPRSETVPASS